MVYYAVVRGHQPGIYTEWGLCKEQVDGHSRNLHMGFSTEEEANDFFYRSKDGVVDKRRTSKGGTAVGSSGEKQENHIKNNFQVDEDGSVTVYTASFVSGFGVFFGPESPLNFSGRVRGKATQHTADIQALTHALKVIAENGYESVIVFTSSQYVIDCMTHYVSEWKKQNWIQKNGEKRPNRVELLDLDAATEGLRVKYQHVPADCSTKLPKELAEKQLAEAKKLAKNVEQKTRPVSQSPET